MWQVLRLNAGMRTLLPMFPFSRRCLERVAAQRRCLASSAASPRDAGKPGPAAADPAVPSPAPSVGAIDQDPGNGSVPVEKDEMGNPRHILLYEGSKRNVLISSSVTVVQGIYWSFYVGVLESHLPTTTWEPWGYLGIGFTAIMAAASHTFARHWVSQISYLPDLRLLSIGTHTFFGTERMPRLVRLVGTVAPRERPNAIYLTFKVRGDSFNSLLDTDDGVFHNREMLMRLLRASPTGQVAEPSAATFDSDGPTTVKTKPRWTRRKRRR